MCSLFTVLCLSQIKENLHFNSVQQVLFRFSYFWLGVKVRLGLDRAVEVSIN